jgi:hypothetical protein
MSARQTTAAMRFAQGEGAAGLRSERKTAWIPAKAKTAARATSANWRSCAWRTSIGSRPGTAPNHDPTRAHTPTSARCRTALNGLPLAKLPS